MNKTISSAMSNGGGVRTFISVASFLVLLTIQTVVVVSYINGIDAQITLNKVLTDEQIKDLRSDIDGITGSTPEGFHRQDAKELSDQICAEIRKKHPDSNCIDPYSLPRYKRAIEQLRRF